MKTRVILNGALVWMLLMDGTAHGIPLPPPPIYKNNIIYSLTHQTRNNILLFQLKLFSNPYNMCIYMQLDE